MVKNHRFPNLLIHLKNITVLLAAFLICGATSAWGQPAPALRAVIPSDSAPESISQLFDEFGSGEKRFSLPGAAWLQLRFSEVHLGPNGVLLIIDELGQSQKFSQAQIDSWGGLSAVFNGSEVRVSLKQGKGEAKPVSARVKDIIIGLPISTISGLEVVTPQPLRNLLGSDIERFIPEDFRRLQKENMMPSEGGATESICGTADDRVTSTNPRVGRIMPVGCTGWLINGDRLLTAGHCTGEAMETVEFNVPASQADGTTIAPPVRDQYRVNATSINFHNNGVGDDWAVFQVLANTETNLMPAAAQGATFQLSSTDNPQQVRVTGYGIDGPPPNFGRGLRNADSQTQQTHVGALTQNSNRTLRYNTDTQPANSGSPVIVEGGNIAIGIHTNGGCNANDGTNAGTSFQNANLWSAIQNVQIPQHENELIWHNKSTGDIQVWYMVGTSRVGFSSVKESTGEIHKIIAPWVLIGTGDFNKDGQPDLLWHNIISGDIQVWYMNGVNRIGFESVKESTGEMHKITLPWALIGTGDFNKDGHPDLLWHNKDSGDIQVWYMNGVNRIGFESVKESTGEIHKITLPWVLIGTGDFNKDGHPDLLWHNKDSGDIQVWYMNGVNRIGFESVKESTGEIHKIIEPWNLIGTGDFNKDGQSDLIWQNINSGDIQVWYLDGVSRIGFESVKESTGEVHKITLPWVLIGVGVK